MFAQLHCYVCVYDEMFSSQFSQKSHVKNMEIWTLGKNLICGSGTSNNVPRIRLGHEFSAVLMLPKSLFLGGDLTLFMHKAQINIYSPCINIYYLCDIKISWGLFLIRKKHVSEAPRAVIMNKGLRKSTLE